MGLCVTSVFLLLVGKMTATERAVVLKPKQDLIEKDTNVCLSFLTAVFITRADEHAEALGNLSLPKLLAGHLWK